jgi:hypothetical protein
VSEAEGKAFWGGVAWAADVVSEAIALGVALKAIAPTETKSVALKTTGLISPDFHNVLNIFISSHPFQILGNL